MSDLNPSIKSILWQQFGASIDMLINVINRCPETYYQKNKKFFYTAFHSAIFLDYYLTIPPSDFHPFLPFTQKSPEERPQEALDDLIPDRHYDQQELVQYLQHSRTKCQQLIATLDDDVLSERFTEGSAPNDMDFPVLEIMLYNLRHTQHHTAQLNLLLRQDLDWHLDWSFRVGDLIQ